mmetsp:Transcript_17433/g.56556  ORF Transcript_17433/g.56556 Transcript_17433/m.56556 type:complete len:242 (-) Transcript_17433:379-1104(-)
MDAIKGVLLLLLDVPLDDASLGRTPRRRARSGFPRRLPCFFGHLDEVLCVGADLVPEPTAECRRVRVVLREYAELVEKRVHLVFVEVVDPEHLLAARVGVQLEGGVGVAEDEDAVGDFGVGAEDLQLLRLLPYGLGRHVRVDLDDEHWFVDTVEALEGFEGVLHLEYLIRRNAQITSKIGLDRLDFALERHVHDFSAAHQHLFHRRRLSTASWPDDDEVLARRRATNVVGDALLESFAFDV